jgi:transposase
VPDRQDRRSTITSLPYAIEGFKITQVTVGEMIIEIHAESTSQVAICPDCGCASTQCHGWYQRHPQAVSSVGRQMRLCLSVKRYRCGNPACQRQTFAEPLSSWLRTFARRTNQLTALLYAVCVEVGAEVAHRIFQHLQIRVSGDTLLRVLRQKPVTPSHDLRVIGVDDWAFKRGRNYGTIIVNLETHQVVDLLPDRTADTLANWLQAHPTIEIVTRDRSTDYSVGIRQGAPQAIQVADRWHLLLNLRQMTERYLTDNYAELGSLPVGEAYQALLDQQRPAFIRTNGEMIASNQKRDERLAFYHQVQQMRQAGWNIGQLARELGRHPATIRKYYYATTFPERKPHRRGRSILDPYLPYLEQRVQNGCENAQQLWREIQQQGYPGTNRQVMKWLQLKRTSPAPQTAHVKRSTTPPTARKATLPSSKQLAWLLVRDTGSLSQTEHILLSHLHQHDALNRLHVHVQVFTQMVKQRQAEKLDSWLDTSDWLGIYQLQTFATGLRQDYVAVRGAIETHWSNGQTEGQVNRLKFIKRQMYGRAKFDLLRLRVLAPP